MRTRRQQTEAIDRAAQALRGASRVLFVTGAGISADSGLPTYRGAGGLYERGDSGTPVEEALSGDRFKERPEFFWRHLHEIGRACSRATFNAAHRALAEMDGLFQEVWVVTQNVDGFHRRAGSRNLIELHGDIHDIMCTECCYRARLEDLGALPQVPRCPHCKALLRPDIVFFGEDLPEEKIWRLDRELLRGFDVVFSVGTTSVFPYVAAPVRLAHHDGVPTVEINLSRTKVSDLVDINIRMRAVEACPMILERVRSL